ncbi:MAG TPA: hypothetical protein VGY53_13390, partial [Isosphaeraceae bacterium]|nr:hypothetical protein [Isosphaeraceae bacterium]
MRKQRQGQESHLRWDLWSHFVRVGTRLGTGLLGTLLISPCWAQAPPPSSYAPVVIKEDFKTVYDRMKGAEPELRARQQKLLEERYDLSDRPSATAKMSRGKKIQTGVRAKLPNGQTWAK